MNQIIRKRLALVFCSVCLAMTWACETSIELNAPLPPGGTGNTTQKPGPNPDTPTDPEPAPIQINPTGEYIQYVLTDRQKFVGLPAWLSGEDYNTLSFSVLVQPEHGQLYGAAPNLVYVPDGGFIGEDSFVYRAAGVTKSLQRRVRLKVSPNFVHPIGIPSPPFGIEESHHMYDSATFDFGSGPEPYKNAGSGPYTHYIDCNTGSNSLPGGAPNPFGTVEFPRKTLPANLPAGSVVEMHGVGFTTQAMQIVVGDGTSAKPIFIRGPSPTQKPILRRPMQVKSNYTIVENLDFDYSDFGSPSLNGVGAMFRVYEETIPTLKLFHHIAVRHCLFHDMPFDPNEGALAVSFNVQNDASSPNDSTSLLENLVVYDIETRNLGQWDNTSGTSDYVGPHFGANTRNVWLLDSHIHHVASHAGAFTRTNALSDQAPCTNGYAGRCYMHHCKESAFIFKHARDSVLSECIIHNSRDSDSGPGDGVAINSNDYNTNAPGSDNIWVLFNEIYDAERGINHTSPPTMPIGAQARSYLIGNIIHDIHRVYGSINTKGVAISTSMLTQTRIVNNTIYNCEHGIWWGTTGLTEPNRCTAVIRNNLIANLSERYLQATGGDGLHLYMTPSSILPYTVVDHNLHWEDLGNVRFSIAATFPVGTTWYFYLTGQMFLTSGLGEFSVQNPPLLKDPDDNAYFLTPGSPATSAGTMDSAFATYQAAFGVGIEFYQDGTPMDPTHVNIGALPVK